MSVLERAPEARKVKKKGQSLEQKEDRTITTPDVLDILPTNAITTLGGDADQYRPTPQKFSAEEDDRGGLHRTLFNNNGWYGVLDDAVHGDKPTCLVDNAEQRVRPGDFDITVAMGGYRRGGGGDGMHPHLYRRSSAKMCDACSSSLLELMPRRSR